MDLLDAPPPPPPDVARRNAAMVSIDITDKVTKAASGECADCWRYARRAELPRPRFELMFTSEHLSADKL